MKKILVILCIGSIAYSHGAAPKAKNNTLSLRAIRIDATTIRAFSRDDFIFIPRADYQKLERLVPGLRPAKHVKKFYRVLSRKLLRLLSKYTVIVDQQLIPNHPDFFAVYINDTRILLLRNSQLMELLLSLAT